VPNPDPSQETNHGIVEAARLALKQAARNLTADIEPAAIYSIAPHMLSEELSAEDDE
jgi:hypothetical protein